MNTILLDASTTGKYIISKLWHICVTLETTERIVITSHHIIYDDEILPHLVTTTTSRGCPVDAVGKGKGVQGERKQCRQDRRVVHSDHVYYDLIRW